MVRVGCGAWPSGAGGLTVGYLKDGYHMSYTLTDTPWNIYADLTSVSTNSPGKVTELSAFHAAVVEALRQSVGYAITASQYAYTVTTPPTVSVASDVLTYDLSVCVVTLTEVWVNGALLLSNGIPVTSLALTLSGNVTQAVVERVDV